MSAVHNSLTMMTSVAKKISDNNSCPKDPVEYCIDWGKWIVDASFLLVELIVLVFRLFITTLESLYITLLPPKEKSLRGEVILITGAGHGIGRELALQLAPHGCTLVCWDIDESGNQDTLKIIKAKGFKNVHAYKCDVSNREQVLKTADLVQKEIGDVTMLINNAGIMKCRNLLNHSPSDIQRTFDINVLSHFWTLEAFLPSMIKKNHGHIVALSSMCGIIGQSNAVPYCASKFAVRGLMESLYEELRAGLNVDNKGFPKLKSQVKFTTVYPIIVGTGLVKNPRLRFPFLLSVLAPDQVARQIIQAVRRNYKELSLPSSMLTLDRISRLFPGKFIQYARDFVDTGVDPDE